MFAKGWTQLAKTGEVDGTKSHRQLKEFGFLSFNSKEERRGRVLNKGIVSFTSRVSGGDRSPEKLGSGGRWDAGAILGRRSV